MMKNVFALIFLLTAHLTVASPIKTTTPEKKGFSSEKLEDLSAFFQSYVDEGKLAGLTTLVARKGKVVHFETYGHQDIAAKKETQTDTIYRIFSMTKPITGIGMMMLWEDGKYKLDDPVSKYLPEFKNPRVYVSTNEDGTIVTEKAKREPTIRDLMRHTSGITYGIFGDHPVDKLYQQQNLFEKGLSLKEMSERVGQQPLVDHPGNQWIYSLATDIQGRLIEVLSGQTLDVFFKERIFKPLKMKDTAFVLDEKRVERLSELYELGSETTVTPHRGRAYWDMRERRGFLSGGGGLASTTEDYFRFAQMLANGGKLDGVRLVKKKTVQLMATNQLPEHISGIWGGSSGSVFGLNFGIAKDIAAGHGYGNVGEFSWGGYAKTLFWVDPKEDIVAVLMTNVITEENIALDKHMRKYVYEAYLK